MSEYRNLISSGHLRLITSLVPQIKFDHSDVLKRTSRNVWRTGVCSGGLFCAETQVSYMCVMPENTNVTQLKECVVSPVQVSVLLPECSSAPSHLDAALNSFSSFYLIRKLPVYEVLDKHFLETAVYQGNTCTRTPAHLHTHPHTCTHTPACTHT